MNEWMKEETMKSVVVKIQGFGVKSRVIAENADRLVHEIFVLEKKASLSLMIYQNINYLYSSLHWDFDFWEC